VSPHGSTARHWKRAESVLVVIYTVAGEVLLLDRRRPRGFWQSVTGSLEWGETPRAAALREVAEETGISGIDGRLIDARHGERFPIVPPWRAKYAPWDHYNLEHWFYLPLRSRRMIQLNPKEHVAYRWWPMAEAARRASSWTNRKAIRWLLGR